jgi:hypothetical protein
VSWRELTPEPGRLWIRFAPKQWPAPERPSLDLVERRIVWPQGEKDAPLPARPERPEVAYLPPVPRHRRAERADWIVGYAGSGGVALSQVDEEEAVGPDSGAVQVLDLLPLLLEGAEPARVSALPSAVAAVLPLIPGLTGTPGEWRPWLDALAASGRRVVLGTVVDLTPTDRRRVAELAGEARWEAVFHGEAAAEREFAPRARAAGLEPFLGRPDVPAPPRAQRNRALATALAEAGDLTSRLGRGEGEAQSLFAAARHAEASALDLAALAREGNLGLLAWLSPAAREIAGEVAEHGRSARLEALRAELLAPPGADA